MEDVHVHIDHEIRGQWLIQSKWWTAVSSTTAALFTFTFCLPLDTFLLPMKSKLSEPMSLQSHQPNLLLTVQQFIQKMCTSHAALLVDYISYWRGLNKSERWDI